jgi:hypothetical protein
MQGLAPLPAALLTTPDVTPTLADALARIILPDVDGQAVRLGSLWEGGPAVVVFLRHYG